MKPRIDWKRLWAEFEEWQDGLYWKSGFPTPAKRRAKIQKLVEKQLKASK